MKRNWQGKVKDQRANNKKAFPTLRPGETKGIAAVGAQQEVSPFVAMNNPQSSGESPENNQLSLPTLQSPDSTSPWPNAGSQWISTQRSAFQATEQDAEGYKVVLEGQMENIRHILSSDSSSASLVILSQASFLPPLSMFTS